MTYWLYMEGASCSNHEGSQAGKVKTKSRATQSSSPLMAVISLILACRWTRAQVRELSIIISYRRGWFHRDTQHEYSSVPQHATPQHFQSHKKKTQKHQTPFAPRRRQPRLWLTLGGEPEISCFFNHLFLYGPRASALLVRAITPLRIQATLIHL